MDKNERLINIELLRVLAMFLIIIGHVLGDDHGNVLSRLEPKSLSWCVLWGIETISVIATNIYILISGFFLSGSEFRPKRILKICVQVWFYSVIFGICSLLTDKFSIQTALNMLTPVLHRTWWFVSSYIGMVMISPLLNKIILGMENSELKGSIIVCLVMFSFIPTLYPITDTFSIGGGTGIVWFATVYLVAGYIRKNKKQLSDNGLESKWKWIYLAVFMTMFSSKMLLTVVTERVFGRAIGTSIFYTNNSPICFLGAVSVFMMFLSMKSDGFSKLIRIIAKTGSLTFGIYLIHNNPFFSKRLWRILSPGTERGTVFLVLQVFAISIFIYILCGLIDYLRELLFGNLINQWKRRSA